MFLIGPALANEVRPPIEVIHNIINNTGWNYSQPNVMKVQSINHSKFRARVVISQGRVSMGSTI